MLPQIKDVTVLKFDPLGASRRRKPRNLIGRGPFPTSCSASKTIIKPKA